MRQTFWRTVAFVVSIPIAYLVIWTILLILARAFGFSISDTGTLFSVLGSIMGAIFTVGGLVVALVAILTQIQLRDRVERVVEDAKQSVIDKFEQELRGEYEKQIKQQVEGMLAFFQATNAHDWKLAEKYVTEALQKYPDLPGALSFLGLRVSNAVIEHFTYQLLMDTLVQPERVGTSVIPMFYAEFALMNPTPPKLEAIHWLEKALQHQDDPEGEVTAALALMYGYSDAYDLMLDTIQKARTLSLALISYFQRPVHLMMLIYACHSLASVEEAMRNVSLQLPKFDEVQRALREASNPKNNSSNIIQLYIEWFGVELTTEGISRTPVKVRIHFPHKEKLTTYGEIFRRSQPSTIIPPQPTTTGIIETFIPVDDILKQLTALGVVLITRI